MKRLITTADDFGLAIGVNEAVERAHLHGILTSASLMVSGPEAADAVRRARALPDLHIGLHLVVIEGPPTSPAAEIPDLLDRDGNFPSDQLRLGIRYFFSPTVRRQLEAEIRAQFTAFHDTGLVLDHANAHKHMHLHPSVGRMMIDIGGEFGLRAIRIPAERPGDAAKIADRALYAWTRLLRRQAARAGLQTTDQVAGLADTGHMTPAIVQSLVDRLPQGTTELYFHPSATIDGAWRRTMPDYQHQAELAALLETRLPADVHLTSFTNLSGPPRNPREPTASRHV